jgi:hypothetical protein
MLDNEISKAYEKAIEKHGMDVERVPKKHTSEMRQRKQFKQQRIISRQF